jgi:hypothetical protein
MLRSGPRPARQQTADAQLLGPQTLAAQKGPFYATTGDNVCKHAIMAGDGEGGGMSNEGRGTRDWGLGMFNVQGSMFNAHAVG